MKNTIKSLLLVAGACALVNSASAATLAGTAQKAGSTVANAGSSVVGGAATLGKGLLSAPGNMFGGLNDGSLPNLSAGIQTFGIAGSVGFSDDITYNLNLRYGYFVKDNWEAGFTVTASGQNSDADFGAGLYTEYNFVRQSKWVPFIGASVQAIGADGDTTGGLAFDFGVKYFLQSNVAITIALGGDFTLDDLPSRDDVFSPTFNIGTQFYF